VARARHGVWARRIGRVLAPTVLVAATVVLTAPIARNGSPVGRDSHYHFLWAAQFIDSLAAGVPYPRWLPDVNRGLGNPTFIFYGPLLYYLAAALYPLAGSVPRALDLAAAATLLASGAAAYRYLRGGLDRGPALLGAVALMALPYPLFDLYRRSALAEFAAFVWPPLAFLAMRRLVRAPTARAAGPAAAGVAAATAGLALTHLPSLVVWGPLFAAGAFAAVPPGRRAAAVGRAWGALALGLGLAGLYLVPAAAERPLVQMEWLDWVARPEEHTLFATGMRFGPVTNARASVIACWELSLAVVAAAAALWPGGGRPWLETQPGSAGERGGATVPVAGAAAAAVGAFALMTPLSIPLWKLLPFLGAIQFPWRLLVILTPAAALLLACGAARVTAPGAPAAARALAAAALVLFGANLVVSQRMVVQPAYHSGAEAAQLAGNAGARDAREYRPRGAPAEEIPRWPQATSLAPGARVRVVAWHPVRRVIAVDAAEGAPLRVGTFLYPGWRAAVDGSPAPLSAGPDGIIEVAVPAGSHVVELRFGQTPTRLAGLALSAASAACLLAWALAGRRGRVP
jgi:hypothetical protein